MARRRATIIATLAALALAGCGPRSDRLAVSGKVALDGAPLDSGTIRFTSVGEKLFSSGALIQDGVYHVPQEKGLPAGTYRVEISSPDEAAAPVVDQSTPRGPGMLVAPERIPAEYNIDSQQTVKVTPDGDNEFDFTIESKFAK